MRVISEENGDFIILIPLIENYQMYCKCDNAILRHISSKGEAGSITAGLFLRRFVPPASKWLHVDMAGVMDSQESGYYTKSATGFGARLLADFTNHVSK